MTTPATGLDTLAFEDLYPRVGDAEPRLIRVDPGAESLPISVVRPTTKYETKAQEAGSDVAELIWEPVAD